MTAAAEVVHAGTRLRVVTVAENRDLDDAMWEVNKLGFAEFMYHDPVADQYFGELGRRFAEYQFALLDDEDTIHLTGACLPFRWDQPLEDLPDTGWDFVLQRGVEDHRAGRAPNVVSAIQIIVRRDLAGTGLSRLGIATMRDIAAAHGITDLVAPVRPNGKARYPLTPMERYVTWRRPDGLFLDPWLRVHERAGARLLKVAPRSMEIAATVAEWEGWTGLPFPESGQYVIAGALNPITIDRSADRGVYVEPNVWMHHRIA